MIRHQFRPGPNQWPLIQLGPGILSVNETTGYTVWGNFVPLIEEALDALAKSYGREVRPTKAELRYINAIPFDSASISTEEFLKRYLHTSVATPVDALSDRLASGNAIAMNSSWKFTLSKPAGEGQLVLANGIKDNREHIIWQLAVRSKEGEVPTGAAALRAWLNEAHDVIDKWFARLAEGELLESFRRKHDGTNQ